MKQVHEPNQHVIGHFDVILVYETECQNLDLKDIENYFSIAQNKTLKMDEAVTLYKVCAIGLTCKHS